MEFKDRQAMFSSSPPTLGQTKDLITNCSPSFPKQCRTSWGPPGRWVSLVYPDPQVLQESLVSREKRARWVREVLEVREGWLDPPALLGREGDLEEMEREDCRDHLGQRASLDYRDFLVWWEPKGTGDTREILAKRAMRDPEG
jgi:hypothetical protein